VVCDFAGRKSVGSATQRENATAQTTPEVIKLVVRLDEGINAA